MPLTFVLCGIAVIYNSIFNYKNKHTYLLSVGLVSICMSFVTKYTIINNNLVINIFGLIGFALVALYVYLGHKITFGSAINTLIVVFVYAVISKFFVETNYVFTIVPLTLTIVLASLPLVRGGGANICAVQSCMLVCVVNIINLSRMNLFFVLFDTSIVSVFVYAECVIIFVRATISLFSTLRVRVAKLR